MTAEPLDWSVPAAWCDEDANQRRVARNHRDEAAMYLERINELRVEHGPNPTAQQHADVRALETSRWHAIEHAALIERRLRGIG